MLEQDLSPAFNRGQLSYSIYAGWRIARNEERMDKPGHRSTFKGQEFDIIAGDISVLYRDDATFSTHPDRHGIMNLKATWKHGNPLWSMYQNYDSHYRGALDLNFVRGDGSAFRIIDIGVDDDRVSRIHYKWSNASKSLSNRWPQLPASE